MFQAVCSRFQCKKKQELLMVLEHKPDIPFHVGPAYTKSTNTPIVACDPGLQCPHGGMWTLDYIPPPCGYMRQ